MNARCRLLVTSVSCGSVVFLGVLLNAGQPSQAQVTVMQKIAVPSGTTAVAPVAAEKAVRIQQEQQRALQAAQATSTTASSATDTSARELPPRVFAGGMPRVGGGPRTPAQIRSEHQQHLQKINRLTFNRRPSAILEAWASPGGETVEKKTAAVAVSTPTVPGAADEAKAEARTFADPFDEELKDFQRAVTLGDWEAVRDYLAILPEDEAKPLYSRLLSTLASLMPTAPTPGMPVRPNMMQFAEKSEVSHADILALAGASPVALEDESIALLGRLLRLALQRGHAVEDFVARAKAEIERPGAVLTRRQAAKLLASANELVEAAKFLPDLETARTENDREALNLLSRYYLALNDREPKPEHLERAWTALQAVLAEGEVESEEKQEALTRAVELATRVREELGEAWLSESFEKRPERGREILAAIGSSTSTGLTKEPHNPDARSKRLELQKTAVQALLKAAPERAEAWRAELELLAAAWLGEAEFSYQRDTSTSLGPQLQRDVYGNYYYYNQLRMQNQLAQQQQNQPKPIKVAEILETRPESGWLDGVGADLRPRFAEMLSKLYLKVAEEDEAFPFIEELAASHPEQSRALAEEFLRVWTRNHDPNADRNRTNMYMYMFGFERRAESIPLTRSKQERNLKELAGWVERLNALPIKPVDETLLTRAFTTCHSSAEVYRLDAIEEVFGAIDSLKPETLAALIQQMRANLASVWRQPAVQEKAKTHRREKDIKAEVMRGYELARSVIRQALEKHPDAWPLVLADASIHLDENNYRQELDPSSDFSRERREALEEFQKAARLYAKAVPDLEEKDRSIEPFTMWFYAGLGASDLGAIKAEMVADAKQPELIRQALLGLPGEASQEHMDQFSNALFTRMSAADPGVKFSYLKAGFAIIGDHEQAHEARKVFDYYKDLVTEIKLDAVVDGPAEVGVDQPFGVLVQLRHTREIERESGGFGRYLQNQNNGSMFYYNYGRPLENYRDKFQKAAIDALDENFEVVSVTFEDEKVTSKATSEYGWRVTPYAYLLLKARSPKVDKLPPLRLDLDFLDTTGYAVLPVESPAVPIDASSAPSGPRPYRNLEIVQTLDERQASEGKLILEVKATALGLVPELEEMLKPGSEGFAIEKTEDQGLSVARFDPESDDTVVSSERLWLITFQGETDQAALPKEFHFAEVLDPEASAVYQRYEDADLAEVEPVVFLEQSYGSTSRGWVWWTVGGVVALAALAGLGIALGRRRPREEVARFRLPETITPFSVLGLLRDIEQNNGLSPVQKQELAVSIESLERHYFEEPSSQEPDLRDIAERWVRGVGR